jgi:hypothetical protein
LKDLKEVKECEENEKVEEKIEGIENDLEVNEEVIMSKLLTEYMMMLVMK